MMVLDTGHFGTALATPYGQTRATSTYNLRALKGRARYRLRDQLPTYLFEITYDWSDEQFGSFQSFWKAVDNGASAFQATLVMVEENPAGFVITDTVLCQSTGNYTAVRAAAWRWQVSMTVEVPAGTSLTGTSCDVIYGGPVILPAMNDIWPGTPSSLATDIVDPCPATVPPPIEVET